MAAMPTGVYGYDTENRMSASLTVTYATSAVARASSSHALNPSA